MFKTQTVKKTWSPQNKKFYEKLGYVFTNYGDKFKVDIKDLGKNSDEKVDLMCDICGNVYQVRYYSIYGSKQHVCLSCSGKHSALKNEILKKLKNNDDGISLANIKLLTSHQHIVEYTINKLISEAIIVKHDRLDHYFLNDKKAEENVITVDLNYINDPEKLIVKNSHTMAINMDKIGTLPERFSGNKGDLIQLFNRMLDMLQ